MNVIIHHTNFKSSKALDSFVKEKVSALATINAEIIAAEVHLTAEKQDFSCRIILEVKGENMTSKRTEEDIHFAILKCIDALKKSLRKQKTIKLNSRQKKQRPNK